jgi:hypothetical protein
MIERHTATQNAKERLSLKDFLHQSKNCLNYFASKWIFIAIALVIGGALGLTYSFLKKPVYTASCTFVLDASKSGGALGQYAGLASMMGVNLGGSGSSIFQSDNILELYTSRKMIKQTLLTPINADIKGELLIDRYIKFNKLREKWEDKPQLKNLNFSSIGNKIFSRVQDSLLNSIIVNIKKNYLRVTKFNDNVNMIQVEVKAKDEVFAKTFNDNIVKNVNDFYIAYKTKMALQNVMILQHQTDSVKNVLNGAISTSAAVIDATPNLNLTRQILRTPAQRSQVNVEANKAILSELVKNLELAKISYRGETPLLELVDTPVYPLEKTTAGKLKYSVISGFLFTIITLLILFINKNLKEL